MPVVGLADFELCFEVNFAVVHRFIARSSGPGAVHHAVDVAGCSGWAAVRDLPRRVGEASAHLRLFAHGGDRIDDALWSRPLALVAAMSHTWPCWRPTYVYRLGQMPGRTPKGTKPMKLAVFGANGPTGRLLTQLALDEDHDVVAFTRHPATFPIEHRRLEVAAGDVHDPVAVAMAIDGADAVVSTLGVPFAKAPITAYSDGAANIVAGMHAAGVKRLLCVSSSAIGPHPEPLGGFIFERVMQPYVVKKLGKTLYDDMRRMEAMVSATDLAWTIVRPWGCSRRRPFPPTASLSTTSATGTRPGSTWPIACCAKL